MDFPLYQLWYSSEATMSHCSHLNQQKISTTKGVILLLSQLSNHELTGVTDKAKPEEERQGAWQWSCKRNPTGLWKNRAQHSSSRTPCDSGVTAHCRVRAQLGPGLTCCSPTNDLTTYFFRSSALGVSSATSLNTFKLWVQANAHSIKRKGLNSCPSHVSATFVK